MVQKDLAVKANKEELAVLFARIPRPVNLKSFDQFFGANVF
jgi:hypothetical protein